MDGFNFQNPICWMITGVPLPLEVKGGSPVAAAPTGAPWGGSYGPMDPGYHTTEFNRSHKIHKALEITGEIWATRIPIKSPTSLKVAAAKATDELIDCRLISTQFHPLYLTVSV